MREWILEWLTVPSSPDQPFPLDPPGAADPAPRCYVLLPCAGAGSRSGQIQPKQYAQVAGRRLVDHTLAALRQVRGLSGIGVVVSPNDRELHSPDPWIRVWHVGGATRAESVHQGLLALQGAGARAHDWVLVHDAARCLVTAADVQRLIDACLPDPVGGLLAWPVPDTLKQATPDASARVRQTVGRSDKWLAQTPQMFRWHALWQALEAARPQGYAGITDEASALEATGAQPLLVRGSAHNLKVTYPEDFVLAEALLQHRYTATPP
jgi:2-C-methyl-D-erythritol 4-phosphate cytidylyltransferase